MAGRKPLIPKKDDDGCCGCFPFWNSKPNQGQDKQRKLKNYPNLSIKRQQEIQAHREEVRQRQEERKAAWTLEKQQKAGSANYSGFRR